MGQSGPKMVGVLVLTHYCNSNEECAFHGLHHHDAPNGICKISTDYAISISSGNGVWKRLCKLTRTSLPHTSVVKAFVTLKLLNDTFPLHSHTTSQIVGYSHIWGKPLPGSELRMAWYYTHNNAILFTIDKNRHFANREVSITFACLDFSSYIAETLSQPRRPVKARFKKCSRLSCKVGLFLSDLKQNEICRQILVKIPYLKFYENPSGRSFTAPM
jgi:hypothetical protein